MTLDIHGHYDYFEYVRLDDDSVPPEDQKKIDVAVLDMNHSWPNVGHDSMVRAVLESAEANRQKLIPTGLKVRVISFDVRRRLQIPQSPNGRFQLYLGTGGPGHIDPRQNDGIRPWTQGIRDNPEWEAPLFRLFDKIEASEHAALISVCHSFGVMCRWARVAHPVLRENKSTGMPTNALTPQASTHPWFDNFADQLPERRYFRVVDNRFFDLTLEGAGAQYAMAVEKPGTDTVTMVELAREQVSGMPRVFGANHHPEIIDRRHILAVLEEKRAQGEVSEEWYRERADMMTNLFQGENERQSRLTSEFTLLGLLRHHLGRLIEERR